ncbi:C40 family peptidase [Nocardia sp. alder85J]|uniref:C40 family peptidase n=1 Tax=Nocardia sp. alder85J TaxID=2862949 RepID=UPI001CD4EF73|nr:C40 family peptidase [Nocardia sp. alder85J]MCX4092926.1 C40 family peptidase [Nocardia sp. alder85J]
MAATASVGDTKAKALALRAQDNASDGLKALVISAGQYIWDLTNQLGTGNTAAPPSFEDLITKPAKGDDKSNYKDLADTTNTSKLSTIYNQNVSHIKNVGLSLVGDDGDVGTQIAGVAGITATTCGKIESAISDLDSALHSVSLPSPPSYAKEGPMIKACFTAMDNVCADVTSADTQIRDYAKTVGDTHPTVVSSDYSSNNSTPLSYTTPLTGTQVQSMISGVTDAKTKKFLETALDQVGDPYVYGAEGPHAFDCSGLVQYSAEQAGIKNVPRTASEQYNATKNNTVSPGNLKPGDLIFPDAEFNNGNPGHVMIYVGDGKVVEAPHTGDHVKVISLSAVGGYHATRF